ncbi:LysR family transcriptional regulator [Amycolatopsis sp. NPDC057786]|uniref:LysR family transcriptional regulator n=1 Tax=Amycolatopsis sp. NPDC057786 TaxID=3346250 RepID=UPI00366DAFDF
MNLGRLQALAMVAKHGSVARAAEILHITPSGVSQQLNKLERETGRPLLEPVGRGVRLTRAGRLLAEHAVRVLAQVAAAEADLAALDQEVAGPLQIGSVGSAIRALLPDVLAELVAEHPRLVVTLCDGEVVDLMPRLLTDELTVLLIESWEVRPPLLPAGVAVRTLVREPAEVALAADHPLADRSFVDFADLAGQTWSCCPAGTEADVTLTQTMRGLGVEPDIRFTVTEFPTQLALVAAGLTAALVPRMAQRPAPEGVRFVRTRPVLHREIRAAWREDDQGPPVRALLAALASRQDAVNRTGSAR